MLNELSKALLTRSLQYYMDLAGNIRRGPAPGTARGAGGGGGGCHRNQALLSKFERRLERDKRDLIKVIIQFIYLIEIT